MAQTGFVFQRLGKLVEERFWLFLKFSNPHEFDASFQSKYRKG
jgi:hypothetical protein